MPRNLPLKGKLILFFICLYACICSPIHAQIISTVAGGSIGDGRTATSIGLVNATGLVTDSAENTWFIDRVNNRIRRIDAATGIVTTIAGGGVSTLLVEGTPALSVNLNLLQAIAIDRHGNLYIIDFYRIYKLDPTAGIFHVVADKFSGTASGDGGLAINAGLIHPSSITVDNQDNVYITDAQTVRKITASTGIINTIAGTGTAGYSGDGGPAVNAKMSSPNALAVDTFGNVYVADNQNNVIRKITASTGIITTFAGTGALGFSGDGGPATGATLEYSYAIATDAPGNVYLTDNNRVRKVSAATGIISTIAGTSNPGTTGDGGPALYASLLNPREITVSPGGNIYLEDNGGIVMRKITKTTGIINTIAGTGSVGYSGIGGSISNVQLYRPMDIAVDRAGNIYLSDFYNNKVYKLGASSHLITTVAGTGQQGINIGIGGPATAASITGPGGIAVDNTGNFYFSDNGIAIRKVSAATGIITTVAGNGTTYGHAGDGGPATAATINRAAGIAVDQYNNIYIADVQNNCIRKVTAATGIISTLAGTGASGYSGDGSAATAATFNQPFGVGVDRNGNVFVADNGNNVVRMINAATGIITTVAGTGIGGYSGDNGLATAAKLYYPQRILPDTSGNIYISDQFNSRIRMVNLTTGIITTFAGTGATNYNGDSIPANTAFLNNPIGLAFDTAGNMYVGDNANNRIRKITRAPASTTQPLLNGVVFYDDNGNGIRDAGERSADSILISVSKPGIKLLTVTKNGIFKIQTDTGAYTVSIDSLPYYTVTPAAHTVLLTAQNTNDSVSFALQPIPGKRDLQISLIPIGPARPGMSLNYRVFYRNTGTVTINNVSLSFVKGNNSYITGTIPSYDSISTDSSTFSWHLNSLTPHQSGSIDINARAYPPPITNPGDYIHSYAVINPVAGDLTPSDDTARLKQSASGSFDPNEKSEAHDGTITPAQVAAGQYLSYMIRFQNTGNDTAFNIIVKDTLDARLDWSSFQMVASDHDYQLSIGQGNQLTWTFNNILLADSFVNEKASHGFINFRIRAKNNLQPGDSISGRSSIYFDFNPPVLTNTVHTVVRPLPAIPPKPIADTIPAGYCGNASGQQIQIANLPAGASAWVRLNSIALPISAGNTFILTPSQLATGNYTLRIGYGNEAGQSSTAYTFGITPPSTPAISVSGNRSVVTSLTDQVLISAANKGGGGNSPKFSFAKDRDFTYIIQAEGPVNTITIQATDLANGDNWIFARMKTSDSCFTQSSATDSIKLTRHTDTHGISDPDNPGIFIVGYPNPFTQFIVLSGFSPAKTYAVDVYNSLGLRMQTKVVSNLPTCTLYTGDWAGGSYWIRITDTKQNRRLGTMHVSRR